jgi:nucleolar protein 4
MDMKKSGKHGGRLILRNIPFSITQEYLRGVLEKIGKVKELTVPMEEAKNRNKGFAFVEFEKKNISEKAVKVLNGRKIQNREVSVDYARDKNTYLSILKTEEASKDFKQQPAEEIPEKTDYQDVKPEPSPKTLNFDEGKVLFITNLNYETQEEDLQDLFSSFGKLKYAKIVLKKDTGESKGTAFVCYKTIEDADKVIKISEEQGIELQDRSLKIMKAVSKQAALNLKSNKTKTDDKRNLYLAKQCLILPGTDLFKTLTPKDIEMRTQAAKKMKEKLLNPNIFVSPTRLLIKNIPKSVTEKDLKVIIKDILAKNCSEIGNTNPFTQVKVMRETDKLDKLGNPLSKGFAFLEFKKHEYALTALKQLNNSNCFGDKHKPIVEFALEDHRIVRIRKIKLNRQKKNFDGIKTLKDPAEKKIGRGKRQRLKKKMMKELNSQE